MAKYVKKHTSEVFPTSSSVGQIFERKFRHILYLTGVHDGIQMHHGTLRDRPMTLLFPNCPGCRFPSQPNTVSTHETPSPIYKSSNHLYGTSVECFKGGLFCVIESSFRNLTISVLHPTPILIEIVLVLSNISTRIIHYVLTISMGFNSQ